MSPVGTTLKDNRGFNLLCAPSSSGHATELRQYSRTEPR